jgi:hypothetical protein
VLPFQSAPQSAPISGAPSGVQGGPPIAGAPGAGSPPIVSEILPGPVAEREPAPIEQIIPGIPMPIIAIPSLAEVPVISMPLAELVERLPRTGGGPAALGLRWVLGWTLMGLGVFLVVRKR